MLRICCAMNYFEGAERIGKDSFGYRKNVGLDIRQAMLRLEDVGAVF
jgi:hypothetical protein